MPYVLIQWIEDLPTWDVLPTTKIIDGVWDIGYMCDVEFKGETNFSPAKILNIGSRSAMMRKLSVLERSVRYAEAEEDDKGLGRGHREKRPRKLTSDSDSGENECLSRPIQTKKQKLIRNPRATNFLEQYRQEKKINQVSTDDRRKEMEDLAIKELLDVKALVLDLQARLVSLEEKFKKSN